MPEDEPTRRAARAEVGMGTVFLYADNKRDLLFLIANDELESITDKAIVTFRPNGSVLANLMRAFRPYENAILAAGRGLGIDRDQRAARILVIGGGGIVSSVPFV